MAHQFASDCRRVFLLFLLGRLERLIDLERLATDATLALVYLPFNPDVDSFAFVARYNYSL